MAVTRWQETTPVSAPKAGATGNEATVTTPHPPPPRPPITASSGWGPTTATQTGHHPLPGRGEATPAPHATGLWSHHAVVASVFSRLEQAAAAAAQIEAAREWAVPERLAIETWRGIYLVDRIEWPSLE